jgi:hypothetical protein
MPPASIVVTPRDGQWRVWLAVLAVVAIYAATIIASWQAMHFGPLPPRLASDLYQHLVLSNLPVADQGTVINPWYHIRVPEAEVAYLRFGLALRAFRIVARALLGQVALALLLWNVAWTLLIAASATFLVSTIEPRRSVLFVTAALGFLLLVDVDAPRFLLARIVYRSTARWPLLSLPYLRTFYPQVAIPLLLMYVALNIRVLRRPAWATWAAMAAFQFAGVLTFPYVALLMTGLTGLSALIYGIGRWPTAAWGRFLAFAGACALGNLLFALGSGPAFQSFTAGARVIRFDPVRLRAVTGYTFVFLTLFSGVVARVLQPRPAVGATFAGLGFATALLSLSDAAVTSSLQISNHAQYFVHTSIALLVIGLGTRLTERTASAARYVLGGAAVLAFGCGIAAAYLTHAWYRPGNAARGEIVLALASAGPRDLLIAPNDHWTEETSWPPLVVPAQVLFARNAEFVLGAEGARIDAQRLALHLYLKGETAESVDRLLAWPELTEEQRFLAGFRRIQPLTGAERLQAIAAVRAELLPPLRAVERLGPDVRDFFRNFHRVFVVDRLDAPFFRVARLETVLQWEGERRTDRGWIVRWGTAR